MAKTKISEWSTTPASNTDIDGINIAEGCAPSGINDAIRDLMSQVRSWQSGASGDPFNGPMNGTIGATTAYSGAFTTVSATGVITSTLATGTAPLTIASTTKVTNLNADLLDGADWASPAALGSTTPAAVSATTLSASGTVSGTGFSNYLASPPAIGGTAPNTGNFTTLTTSSTVTLNGGTANGVTYLNGSKVLTSGSALTFNGSKLEVSSSGEQIKLTSSGDFSSTGTGYLRFYDSVGAKGYVGYGGTASRFDINTGSSMNLNMNAVGGTMTFQISNSEQMRLTSTGLGIGTSSPASKFDLEMAASTNGGMTVGVNNSMVGTIGTGGFSVNGGAITDFGIRANANLLFATGSGAPLRMTLDSAGNLGLGVTPSAWGIGKALQVNNASLMGYLNRLYANANTYFDGTGTGKYIASDYATSYQQVNGIHQWFNAASGNAGDAISFIQAMTLDASGNLGVGTTLPQTKLTLAKGSGNVAPTTITGANAFANIGYAEYGAASNGKYMISFGYFSGATNAPAYIGLEQTATGSYTKGDLTFYTRDVTTDTAPTERARIDSAGRLLVGTATQRGKFTSEQDGSVNDCAGFNNTGSGTGSQSVASFYRSGTFTGNISNTGSATAYNTSSDYRLKENAQPLTGSGAFIDALQPKTWDWKADGSKGVGFIAHEAQAVSPSSVTGNKDAVDENGNPIMQAMEYGSAEFIANIIAELQSLRQRVAQLETN